MAPPVRTRARVSRPLWLWTSAYLISGSFLVVVLPFWSVLLSRSTLAEYLSGRGRWIVVASIVVAYVSGVVLWYWYWLGSIAERVAAKVRTQQLESKYRRLRVLRSHLRA